MSLTISPAEAAAQIGGVTARWLTDKASAGLIPHRRIGRKIRFTADDVQAIVDQARRQSAPTNPAGLRPTARSQARRAS